MFSKRFTLALILLLFAPFFLRKIDLEPYPAILFPSGASRIKESNGYIKIQIPEIYGKDKNGQWQIIKVKEFLNPIPVPYLPYLVSHNFGLKPDVYKVSKTKYKILSKMHLVNNRNPTGADIQEVKSWIKAKLLEQQLKPSVIMWVLSTETISATNGSILEKQVSNERVIRLD